MDEAVLLMIIGRTASFCIKSSKKERFCGMNRIHKKLLGKKGFFYIKYAGQRLQFS